MLTEQQKRELLERELKQVQEALEFNPSAQNKALFEELTKQLYNFRRL